MIVDYVVNAGSVFSNVIMGLQAAIPGSSIDPPQVSGKTITSVSQFGTGCQIILDTIDLPSDSFDYVYFPLTQGRLSSVDGVKANFSGGTQWTFAANTTVIDEISLLPGGLPADGEFRTMPIQIATFDFPLATGEGSYPGSNTMVPLLGSVSLGYTAYSYAGNEVGVASADAIAVDFFENDTRNSFKVGDTVLAQLTDGTYLLTFISGTTAVVSAFGT